MHATLFTLSTLLLATFAAAAPGGNTGTTCSTGPVQCCNTVEKASDPAVATLLGSLGVVLQDTTVALGLKCSPITAVGVGAGSACSANAVCCENNSFVSIIW